jgi:hypothetical protein
MKRILAAGALLLVLAGCQTADRLPLAPLPPEGQPVSYAELYARARRQTELANAAFYDNHWEELADTARGLAETAKYMVKATEVPPGQKDTLAVRVGDLGKDAGKLREAALAKKVEDATAVMTRITKQIRELNPSNK